jgi:TusA-related sulfurtransferase
MSDLVISTETVELTTCPSQTIMAPSICGRMGAKLLEEEEEVTVVTVMVTVIPLSLSR